MAVLQSVISRKKRKNKPDRAHLFVNYMWLPNAHTSTVKPSLELHVEIFDTGWFGCCFFSTPYHITQPGPKESNADRGLIFTMLVHSCCLNYCTGIAELPVRKTQGVSYLKGNQPKSLQTTVDENSSKIHNIRRQ